MSIGAGLAMPILSALFGQHQRPQQAPPNPGQLPSPDQQLAYLLGFQNNVNQQTYGTYSGQQHATGMPDYTGIGSGSEGGMGTGGGLPTPDQQLAYLLSFQNNVNQQMMATYGGQYYSTGNPDYTGIGTPIGTPIGAGSTSTSTSSPVSSGTGSSRGESITTHAIAYS